MVKQHYQIVLFRQPIFSHYALFNIQVSAKWVYWGSSKKFPRKKIPDPKPNPNLNLTLTLTLYGFFFVGEGFVTALIQLRFYIIPSTSTQTP